MEKEPTPAKEVTDVPAKSKDYSRDFMSYYVAGGDDDEVEEVAKPPPPKPKITEQAPAHKLPRMNVAFPETKFKNHHGPPPTYPTPKLQAPRPPQFIQPTVRLVDNIQKPTGPREPDTVANMVKKLEALSTALTLFGGVPAVPTSPKKNDGNGKSARIVSEVAHDC